MGDTLAAGDIPAGGSSPGRLRRSNRLRRLGAAESPGRRRVGCSSAVLRRMGAGWSRERLVYTDSERSEEVRVREAYGLVVGHVRQLMGADPLSTWCGGEYRCGVEMESVVRDTPQWNYGFVWRSLRSGKEKETEGASGRPW